MPLICRLPLHCQIHTHVAEIERTTPPVRNTNNDPRISWASCEGMLHTSLVQFNIICVKETLLKGFNCSENNREGRMRSTLKLSSLLKTRIDKQYKIVSLGEML